MFCIITLPFPNLFVNLRFNKISLEKSHLQKRNNQADILGLFGSFLYFDFRGCGVFVSGKRLFFSRRLVYDRNYRYDNRLYGSKTVKRGRKNFNDIFDFRRSCNNYLHRRTFCTTCVGKPIFQEKENG